MVVPNHRPQVRARLKRGDDVVADDGVKVHLHALFVVQLSGLEQDRVRDSDLADVVDDAAPIQDVLLLSRQAHPGADPPRPLRHAQRMRLGVRILGLDRGGQRVDDLLRAVQRVVNTLQPQRRADASDELGPVYRLRHVVVGAGIESADPVSRVLEGRDHHDRQEPSLRKSLDPLAYLEPVQAWHLHVEQHNIGSGRFDRPKCGHPIFRGADLAVDAIEAGRDELAVRQAVVDHQHDGYATPGRPCFEHRGGG